MDSLITAAACALAAGDPLGRTEPGRYLPAMTPLITTTSPTSILAAQIIKLHSGLDGIYGNTINCALVLHHVLNVVVPYLLRPSARGKCES
jgi:hypothetical protein